MSKIIKENCRSISVYKFKEWGILKNNFCSGAVEWDNGRDGKNRIGYFLNKGDKENMFLKLSYTITDYRTEEKHTVEQKYPLLATPCNYGGERYWFICSAYHNGIYCGRRVAKLFLGAGGHYFACRHCYDLTYRSRLDDISLTAPDLDEYADKIKRWYYNGKPTRKHLIYKKKENKFRKNLYNFMAGMNGRLERLAKRKK